MELMNQLCIPKAFKTAYKISGAFLDRGIKLQAIINRNTLCGIPNMGRVAIENARQHLWQSPAKKGRKSNLPLFGRLIVITE